MEKFNKIKNQLNYVSYQMPIYSSQRTVWDALQKFGEIASFHDNVVSSGYINDTEDFKINCERYCEFQPQMGRIPIVKEKIIAIDSGVSYLIHFYEFENFPMNHMYIEFCIDEDFNLNNNVKASCWYQSKPKILTKLFTNKMRQTLKEILLGYRHYIETGEKNVDMKHLKKEYKIL